MSQTFAKAPERLDKSGTQAPVGRGPRVVPLQSVAQVMRGTYFNPLRKDAATPLPRHYWELHSVRKAASDPLTVIRGTASDTKTGISHILNGKKLKEAAEDQAWFLVLRPEITDEQLLQITAPGLRELWIDLEKNSWVVLSHFPQFEKRKLLRVPIWTSPWKARSGGFKVIPPNEFATRGTLTTQDVRTPFGTPADPWEIQIDFGWFRTYLQFHYYDPQAWVTKPVPPGLCVKALGKKLDVATLTWGHGRVGGGTAIDDQGTIYVLHERDPFTSGDVELCFENTSGEALFVDLSVLDHGTRKDVGLKRAPKKKVPEDRMERYLLPNAWHTKGMEAKVGAAGSPKKWEEMRPTPMGAPKQVMLVTDQANPLVFHLDDTVLYDHTKGLVALPANARITIFNQLLMFRDPLDSKMPPLWNGNPNGGYLRAEEAIVVEDSVIHAMTFVINHEGDFYVLREGRVDGEFGKTPHVGARKAVARAPENPIGDYLKGFPQLGGEGMAELHLLPDPAIVYLEDGWAGPFLKANPRVQLCHLLVYVPLTVVPDPKAPTSVTPAQVEAVYPGLLAAADRWGQGHPSNRMPSKDYVVIPEAGVKERSRVVKIRFFFGPRTDGKHALTIEVLKQVRAHVSRPVMRIQVGDEQQKLPVASDSDNEYAFWFTLAHEFGHVIGLPDEYLEPLDLTSLSINNYPPTIPRIPQVHEAYPFCPDEAAMMRTTMLPRLRYAWHLLYFLNNDAGARAQLPEGPYVASYSAFKGGTTHILPAGNSAHPWTVVGKQRLPSARASVVLYRVGDDEGTVERMFDRPRGIRARGEWLNGIAVVVTRIWFNFVASTDGDFPNDAARWRIIQDFFAHIFDDEYKPHLRFLLEGPPGTPLRRIVVTFEPRLEFGPLPTKDARETDADFVVDVVFQKKKAGPPAPPQLPMGPPQANAPPRLLLNAGEVGLHVLRFAIDGKITNTTPLNNALIMAAELDDVKRLVEQFVGSPAGSFTVKELA